MNQEILKMPKVELHCHLDGSLTLASVREILGKDISPEELQVQPDCQNLAEYLQKFDLPIQCLQTPEGIKRKGSIRVICENPKHKQRQG